MISLDSLDIIGGLPSYTSLSHLAQVPTVFKYYLFVIFPLANRSVTYIRVRIGERMRVRIEVFSCLPLHKHKNRKMLPLLANHSDLLHI